MKRPMTPREPARRRARRTRQTAAAFAESLKAATDRIPPPSRWTATQLHHIEYMLATNDLMSAEDYAAEDARIISLSLEIGRRVMVQHLPEADVMSGETTPHAARIIHREEWPTP